MTGGQASSKPPAAAPAPERRGAETGPTFGEAIARLDMVAKAGGATREIIARSTATAVANSRLYLRVVSCFDCTAPKACCWLVTGVFLYEAVPIAARLIGLGRDTPAFRDELRRAAEAMETTRLDVYRQPCVFLDGDERCTIYDDRPSVCGTHLVWSPARACGDRSVASVVKVLAPLQDQVPPRLERQFRLDLGLRPLDEPYHGALPRMVLLCLEAWRRRDYVEFLAEHAAPAARRHAWAADLDP